MFGFGVEEEEDDERNDDVYCCGDIDAVRLRGDEDDCEFVSF